MKKSRKEVEQRRQIIMDILASEEAITANILSERLGVSAITIRRDLQYWEMQNRISTGYGKIKLQRTFIEQTNEQSKIENRKHNIAKRATHFVDDGDTIFINTSSTALLMLHYIKDKKINVITNNANAVFIPKDYRVNIILTGGELHEPKESMVGEIALNTISKVTANKCFIGCSGVTVESGITTKVLAEVPINELMLKNTTGQKFILADSTKIGHDDSFVSSSLKDIDYIITDSFADKKSLIEIIKNNVNIIKV